MLLHHRPLLAVEVQRTALRELSIDFRDDRVGFGEARLAVEQLGQKDETLFPGGRRRILREACPLDGFRFSPAFLNGQRARALAGRGRA